MNRDPASRLLRLAVVAGTITVAFAAGCAHGGGTGAAVPSASPTNDVRSAGLAFSTCMRDHGYNVPDPTYNDQGWPQFQEPDMRGNPQYEAVRAQCRTRLDAAALAAGAPSKQEMQDQLLAFAACMREHGVNMADPTDGGLQLDSALLSSPNWKPSAQACESHLPAKYKELAEGDFTSGKGGAGKGGTR